MSPVTVRESHLSSLPLISRGKVRDLYDAGERLLLVASDRLSAFDVVLPTPIPDKGAVLTQISLFWFDYLRGVCRNHLISARMEDFPASVQGEAEQLRGRTMLVKKLQMFPVECVVRGYLSGSGWKEYQRLGTVCGLRLPAGLRESDRLPEPIFTPSSKALEGHDENITMAQVEGLIGNEAAARLQSLSLEIYRRAAAYAESRGIILADTKFEFGLDPADPSGEPVLADEVLTPDSSRFWPRESYQPGRAQESYDKQYVRDYLEQIGWNKQPPAPALPDEVVRRTSAKYRAAYRELAGRELEA
ncbi:MAG TPA: phosphoribosylaminoimidazolesuccinocarboxamide synthase [Terriglobales bacterium]|nr:phosphoribosylaminoimidazolesuccinocarboxamide synthase [Terriglobales bacterium]